MSAEVDKSQQRPLSADRTGEDVRTSAMDLSSQVRWRLEQGHSGQLSDHDEVIHQTRVDMKRLRALWYLVQPGLSKHGRAQLHQSTQSVASALSGQRDQAVMLALLAEIDPGLPEGALMALEAEIHLRTVAAEVDGCPLEAALQSLELLDLTIRSVDWAAFRRRHLEQGLIWTGCKSQELCRRAIMEADVKALHRWRKWVKVWLYQVQWLLPDASTKWVGLLKPLGSNLGNIHDFDVFLELLRCIIDPELKAALEELEQVVQLKRRRELALVQEMAEVIYAKPAERRCHKVFDRWLKGR
ncbi:hypothetical protein GCM10009104_33760 [Marinobacterium maritimum]|uniref:CHAD domain-containing protein n=1 Tax=Marinobacterium maritimum TaxID=500162 RepID=A0ABN1IAL6_9GAMM